MLLTGASPLALGKSIYYLRAYARENHTTLESIPSFTYGGPNPPRVLYQLMADTFWFSDTIDQRSYNYIMLTTKNL